MSDREIKFRVWDNALKLWKDAIVAPKISGLGPSPIQKDEPLKSLSELGIDTSLAVTEETEQEIFESLKQYIIDFLQAVRKESPEMAEYLEKNMIMDKKTFTFKYVGDERLNKILVKRVLDTLKMKG